MAIRVAYTESSIPDHTAVPLPPRSISSSLVLTSDNCVRRSRFAAACSPKEAPDEHRARRLLSRKGGIYLFQGLRGEAKSSRQSARTQRSQGLLEGRLGGDHTCEVPAPYLGEARRKGREDGQPDLDRYPPSRKRSSERTSRWPHALAWRKGEAAKRALRLVWSSDRRDTWRQRRWG